MYDYEMDYAESGAQNQDFLISDLALWEEDLEYMAEDLEDVLSFSESMETDEEFKKVAKSTLADLEEQTKTLGDRLSDIEKLIHDKLDEAKKSKLTPAEKRRIKNNKTDTFIKTSIEKELANPPLPDDELFGKGKATT